MDDLAYDTPTITIHGVIDTFTAPRFMTGWVRSSTGEGNGLDIAISVYRDGRLIAEGKPTRWRPDIVDNPDHLTGFGLTCTEDISDEMIAFDQLTVEASDSLGTKSRLKIWDRIRGTAFDNLLNSSTPLGRYSVSAILRALSESKELSEDERKGIQYLYDVHFERKSSKLLYSFESLGKDCSFGSVQRFYGAEPLGLLRFSGIGVEDVTRALNNRFLGVGSREFTRLELHDSREYYTKDTRYHMWSHTFVFEGDVDSEKFYDQQCKKISFLVRNIIEKLEQPGKIFVIHALPETISSQDLQALLKAIRRYGDSPLLYLESAPEADKLGTVMMRDDGIMIGFVPTISLEMAPPPELCEIWLKVCRRAAAMAVIETKSAPQIQAI